ncbi:ABC transporter ATP-binding protein [Cellulomonas citrea]|uniref:ABC transporter ATP-binding protein n=1 Tax=Cellulomonas citrea TaxID=1909423 RepID=UPI00135BC8F3|nr:ABC transporter ATP-binding protein [Cellulomonas citrea]
MIEAHGLSKVYGTTRAVDDISFTVRPGIVTGFLGPNGAGKSTTMRMIMGLDRPTSGTVTVNGKPYVEHRAPLTQVGALLEAKAVHPGRTARQHLRVVGATHGLGARRVDEVLEMTGLGPVADKRVKGFSLGMGQRLGIAVALLGDPSTLILDEPVNGLDPEGVIWVRDLVRYLAGQGRTVFLSSHLMAEMAQTADHVIVIGRGRILADAPMATLLAGPGQEASRARAPRATELAAVLRSQGLTVTQTGADTLEIVAGTPAVAEAALAAGIAVHELAPVRASLEDAYLALTADEVEYHSGVGAPANPEVAR